MLKYLLYLSVRVIDAFSLMPQNNPLTAARDNIEDGNRPVCDSPLVSIHHPISPIMDWC
jgi:hypothetical protein